jgi:hypothetical protein
VLIFVTAGSVRRLTTSLPRVLLAAQIGKVFSC